MVMSYPEVIRNNMGERLAETNTPYLCPFLPLHDKKRIGKRLAEELKAWNLPAHESKPLPLPPGTKKKHINRRYTTLPKNSG